MSCNYKNKTLKLLCSKIYTIPHYYNAYYWVFPTHKTLSVTMETQKSITLLIGPILVALF
jgi:hypothetical protein